MRIPSLEHFFGDDDIVDQSVAMIKLGGRTTNGILITVKGPCNTKTTEIVLPYEELKEAVSSLEADREAMPELFCIQRKTIPRVPRPSEPPQNQPANQKHDTKTRNRNTRPPRRGPRP